MLTPLTNIVVSDNSTRKNTYTAASGWVVSQTFNNGAPSHPFTFFLQSPVTVNAWSSSHVHRITARELSAPVDHIQHSDAVPSTPPLIVLW